MFGTSGLIFTQFIFYSGVFQRFAENEELKTIQSHKEYYEEICQQSYDMWYTKYCKEASSEKQKDMLLFVAR